MLKGLSPTAFTIGLALARPRYKPELLDVGLNIL